MAETDPDAQHMLDFAAGDGAAFDALFQKWAGPLLRYLERMVRNAATAEELVQETFLRVHRARDRYEPSARFSTWLYRIATNLALNELRRPSSSRPHASTDDEEGAPIQLEAGGPAVDDAVHARRMSAQLEAELEKLPERQRTALWLAAGEGLSYAEIAEVLETSEKSVKALVHRGRTAVVARLKPVRSDTKGGKAEKADRNRTRGAR